MKNVFVVMTRELWAYFSTPLAYIFIVIFLALSGALTFYLGNFFALEQANLNPFFNFHPWLYLFLMPAVSMRLWAEERKTGTIEVLMTLPISPLQAVLGKFFAAWAFTGIALVLTFPMWITVNYLGNPDNGVIFASYLGSFLMGGAFLAVGSCLSAVTKNQVIAFILAATVSFLFLVSGLEMVVSFFSGWAPDFVVDAVTSLSFINHFASLARGVLDVRDIIYFASLIIVALFINTAILDLKRAS